MQRRAIDVSFILYAEHEFNASTFTARVIAATASDFYSAITGGIGALRGALHGGANEGAMELIVPVLRGREVRAHREGMGDRRAVTDRHEICPAGCNLRKAI
jgi:citrate synthase